MKLSINYIGGLLKTAEDLYKNKVDESTRKRFEEYTPVVKEILKQATVVGMPLAAPFLSIGLAFYDRNKDKKREEIIKELSELLDEIKDFNKEQLDDINKNHGISLNYLLEIQCDIKEIREITIRTETKVDGLKDDAQEILRILKQSIPAKSEDKLDDKKYIQKIIKNKGYNYIESIISENKQSDAEGFLYSGNANFYFGNYEEAEEEYRKAIGLNPKFAEAHKYIGNIFTNLKRYKEAENEFKKAIELNPNFVDAHSDYGFLLHEDLYQFEDAEKHFKEALRIDPKHAYAHNNYGNLLQSLNRFGEAEKHYEESLRIDSEYAYAHNNYGALLTTLNRYKEAEKHFKKALQIAPEYAEANGNYGALLTTLNRFKEAEKHFKKALQIAPEYAGINRNYGALLTTLNRFKDAEKHFKKALKSKDDLSDSCAGIHNDYGILLAKSERFREAEEQFKVAIRINPIIPESHMNYGNLLEISGRIDESIKEFETSLKLLEEQGRKEDMRKTKELLSSLVIAREIRKKIGDDYKSIEFYDVDENGKEIFVRKIEKKDINDEDNKLRNKLH